MLWIGLLISISGSRMQLAAVLWHVNVLTGQPIALGGVGLASITPILLFSLVGGVLADTINRRRLMFFTQSGLTFTAAVLGVLTLLGLDSIWLIYAILAINGAIASFDLPARQALVPNLLPEEVLTNAFTMNSIAFQFGSIVGPALGGVILAQLGIAHAYLFNAASYLAVILALIRMGPVNQDLDRGRGNPAGTLRRARLKASVGEGLRYVLSQPIIFSSMLLDFFATFFSSATALLPIFAASILQVGEVGYGWLLAAPSIGAGAIAVALSAVRQIRRQGVVLLVSVAVFGVATIVFGVSTWFWLTFAALAVTGAADSVSAIIRNTIRQLQTPDYLRGRMTSVNQIFFMGGPQLGELEAGVAAQFIGAPLAVVTGGIGCLIATAWVAVRYPGLRRYQGDEAIRAGSTAIPPAGDRPVGRPVG